MMILRMTLNLPNDAAYVPIVRSLSGTLMDQLGIVREDIEDTSVVIGEICANVVRHSHMEPEARYVVEVDYHLDHILLRVTDHGEGFDRTSVPPPSLDQAGGWGLWLVENLAERVEFRPLAEGGTAVSAELTVHYTSPGTHDKARQMAARGEEGGPGVSIRRD